MGFYSPNALLRDVMRHGVEVRPVCVNRSQWETTLERKQVDSTDYAIRFGLHMVSGLRQQAAEKLLESRRVHGGWVALEDFLLQCRLGRGDLTSIAAANALQGLGIDRRAAFWLAEAADFSATLEDVDLVHQFAAETPLEKVQRDFKATSTTLGEHPTRIIRRLHWCFPVPLDGLTPADRLTKLLDGRSVHVFGMVLVRQAPSSAKGMVFFTLEDETGYMNLVFTPQVYDRFHEAINMQGFLCVSGKLQRQHEGHSILVRSVYRPSIEKADVLPIRRKGKLEPKPQKPGEDIKYKARNYM